jgi:diketogulonate reductase-like aldo/keto reductase
VYGQAQSLLEFCDSKGIHIESYGPLSSIVRAPGGPVDPVVKKIAQELGATDGQVLLKWAHQITNGGIVLTTSSKKERLEEQIKAFTEIKDLSDEQVKAIGEAGKEKPQRIFVSRIIVVRGSGYNVLTFWIVDATHGQIDSRVDKLKGNDISRRSQLQSCIK